MANRLLHIFFNADLRGMQPSLIELAKKERNFSLSNFKKGDLIAFVNKKKNKIKILAALEEEDSYHVLAYYRSPHERRITETALQYIPKAFSSGRLKMDEAIKEDILKRF